MKLYINNLIPRLRQFSENLDKKEIFVDIPWVILDENLNQQKYIFKRNGDLIMSLNGQVTIGKWEYLSAARSLLIDRIQDKILLNQNFIDPAVMVLKKDGLKDENMILANEIRLPDLDVLNYLKRLYYERNNIPVKQLKSGEYLEFNQFNGFLIGTYVTIEGETVANGSVQLAEYGKKYEIRDSRITKVLVMTTYETNKGNIVVEQEEYRSPAKGDFVYQNEKLAPDGKYRLGLFWNIVVENGRIIKS